MQCQALQAAHAADAAQPLVGHPWLIGVITKGKAAQLYWALRQHIEISVAHVGTLHQLKDLESGKQANQVFRSEAAGS